jgi:hypothetical protein
LPGGRYSEVVISSGLTVFKFLLYFLRLFRVILIFMAWKAKYLIVKAFFGHKRLDAFGIRTQALKVGLSTKEAM